MKIVFMGTPDFAVPALLRLIKEHDVVCVYTKEPKIAGRGNEIKKSPIHLLAEQHFIEVRTPKSLKLAEEQRYFASLNADIAVVAAYGLILPKPILEAFPYGCLNIHASILPRWRGAAPIQRAIEAGDNSSGVTIMKIAEGLDTGDMLLKKTTIIDESVTGEILHDKLAELGADAISEALKKLKSLPLIKQDESLACYALKIDKSECKIDFNQKTNVLFNKIRAFSPYPAMFFEYKGERFKILFATTNSAKSTAGEIIEGKKKLLISCADGSLNITKIQRQGKKPMAIDELLRGFCFDNGYILS